MPSVDDLSCGATRKYHVGRVADEDVRVSVLAVRACRDFFVLGLGVNIMIGPNRYFVRWTRDTVCILVFS